MPPKKLLNILFLSYGMPWCIAALSGICIFVVLGFAIDYRFFVLALIWIFLVIPLVVAFLYFYYGMEPLTAFNTIPHKLVFDNDIIIKIIEHADDEKEAYPVIKEYPVKKNEYRYLKSGGDYILLFFSKKGWIWIPVAAFETFDQFKTVVEDFKIS